MVNARLPAEKPAITGRHLAASPDRFESHPDRCDMIERLCTLADVVIVGAARTPIGRYGGSFRNVHPAELGAVATRAALERAGVSPDAGRRSADRPRPAGRVGSESGASGRRAAPAFQTRCLRRRSTRPARRACRRSPTRRAVDHARRIATSCVAGGIESMSRMPYLVDAEDARWGHSMGNFTLVDAMYRDGFTCSAAA